MYIPIYTKVENFDIIKQFIQENSFGALITKGQNDFNANHYPFLLTENGDKSLILWVKLNVTSIEAKFKLSQNRNPNDYSSIVHNLETSSISNDKNILKYMQMSPPHNF